MAKGKAGAVVPNRPIYSRISFLYQAAAYLSSHTGDTASTSIDTAKSARLEADFAVHGLNHPIGEPLSRRLITDMRSTAKKTQIRLSPATKHTVCKYCDTLLIEGQTSTTSVENPSKGGRKPWADVLVIRCHRCERVKRFPVQASRQKRRPMRKLQSAEDAETTAPAATGSLMQADAAAPVTTSSGTST